MVLDSKVGRGLVREPTGSPGEEERGRAGPYHLTKRQVQLLLWIAQGKTNAEIAGSMSLSERTVKAHVAAVFHKLGVNSRTTAVATAVRLGILKAEEL